jgi:glycosyltransferase involved in cell wall biosynthesis
MRVAFLPEGRSPSSALDPLWSALWVARRRPDVFFQPGYNPPLRAAAPFVFTIHDLNHLEIPANSSPIKRAYYTLLIRPACRRAFRVLTVSEFSRRAIVAWSGVPADRVINVGNGVGSEFSPEGPSHQPGYRYFLYVGNRKPHKNLPRLLEGYARSGVSDRHVLLLSGDPEPSILRLLPQLGLTGERIRFAGPINDEDLPAYYRGASALLLPSLYEGFGLPALEAMACGTPVIVGDAAALPEIVSGAGLLVEPTSGDSIAAGIRGLDANAGLRRRLRVLGLDRARHYSWEETARRVRSVLHDAIQAC